MKYEIIHDTIARQIYEKASNEARTRRKVERFIRERHEAHLTRGAKLTRDDIDYVTPYLSQVNITPEQEAYIEKGRKALQAAKRKIQLLVSVLLVMLAFSVVSLGYGDKRETENPR